MCLSLKRSDCIICFIDQLETVIKTKLTDQLKTWLSFHDFNQIIAMAHLITPSHQLFFNVKTTMLLMAAGVLLFSWRQINSGVARLTEY